MRDITAFPNGSNTVSIASEEWLTGNEKAFFTTMSPEEAKEFGLLLIEAAYQSRLNEEAE